MRIRIRRKVPIHFENPFFRPLLLYLAFIYVTQILLTHFCFLQKDESGERVLALDNRYYDPVHPSVLTESFGFLVSESFSSTSIIL